jgi:hypothetical protein
MIHKSISDLRVKLLQEGLFDCRHHSIQMWLKELKLLSQEYPREVNSCVNMLCRVRAHQCFCVSNILRSPRKTFNN